MNNIIYILVILFATTLGSFAGIGGGVIIKPAFDALGEYSAAEISVICALAVFSMSIVSTIISAGQIKKNKKDLKFMLPLAAGAAAGGWIGEAIFSNIKAGDSQVKIIQNIILFLLILFVAIYMKGENKKSLNKNNLPSAIMTGLLLGCVSAFLGIGGGPINVAVITLVFGVEIKNAVLGSIAVILFSQGTKLAVIAARDISSFDIKILPFAAAAGVCGALIGRRLNKKASGKAVTGCFVATQILILGLCVFNIIKYAL